MANENDGEALTIKDARELMYKASQEFSRIKALAWAADMLLCGSPDATISHLELERRISYLVQVIAEKADDETAYFDRMACRFTQALT